MSMIKEYYLCGLDAATVLFRPVQESLAGKYRASF